MDGLRGTAAVLVGGSLTEVADGHQSDTRFQIASVSKQFAATAALLLVRRGALNPHEPLNSWLPGRDITLHHLLSHTAGLGHWPDYGDPDELAEMTTAERIELVRRAPLRTPPGTEWHYSSLGYLIVAAVVEHTADQPYADFLAEQICTPLGLDTITAAKPADPIVGHNGGVPVPPWDTDLMAGTGDIWSTAADLARWTTALHHGDLLDPAQLVGPYAALPAQEGWLAPAGYGYGLFTGTMAGRPVVFHPGDNPGFLAAGVWLPAHDVSIAVLTNDETTDVVHVVRQLATDHGLSSAEGPESP